MSRLPIFFTIVILFTTQARAQPIAIRGAAIHTVSGQPIANGTIVFENGIITAIGVSGDLELPAGSTIIDADGMIVTPGLIDVATSVGIVEVNSVPGTQDDQRTGDPIRAAFRVIDGINPNSVVIPAVRSRGVTTVGTIPRGGIISGQSSLIDLNGPTLNEMLVEKGSVMHGAFNESAASSAGGSRGAISLQLREALDDAQFWSAQTNAYDSGALRSLSISRLDAVALKPVLNGAMPFIVAASRASDIDAVLRIGAEYGIQTAILGGEEAWMMAPKLAESNISVIVAPLSNSPVQFDRLGTRFDNAALLSNAGVRVVISTMQNHTAGTLRREAGNAVRFGMDWSDALRAVTLSAAEVTGVEESRGSLEVGKIANIVVWSGDPFQFSSSPSHVYIRGREIELNSRQKRLLERYRTLDDVPNQYKGRN